MFCAARAIAGVVASPGKTCVGFVDIHAVFHDRGPGAVGLGVSAGPHRAERAAADALSCPFLQDLDVTRPGGVFAEVAAADPRPDEIERVTESLGRAVGDGVAMIVGDAAQPHLADTMRVTLVATEPSLRGRS
jgi:cell division protein FtsZ